MSYFPPVAFFHIPTKETKIIVTQEAFDRFFDNRSTLDWVRLY